MPLFLNNLTLEVIGSPPYFPWSSSILSTWTKFLSIRTTLKILKTFLDIWRGVLSVARPEYVRWWRLRRKQCFLMDIRIYNVRIWVLLPNFTVIFWWILNSCIRQGFNKKPSDNAEEEKTWAQSLHISSPITDFILFFLKTFFSFDKISNRILFTFCFKFLRSEANEKMYINLF